MPSSTLPRVVVVHRPTDYELLLARHGTREQARFFLETRGRNLDVPLERHALQQRALSAAAGVVPSDWRSVRVGRADLDRFLFEPCDIVVAVGQDGLVANVAKYLSGQPVVGINPDPERHDGILVPHPPEALPDLLATVAAGHESTEDRTMVEARLDDGQTLLALNEVFIGHATHQSARYRIRWKSQEERHSSSGVIVTTGTGATGWARSIRRQRRTKVQLPEPTEPRLAFFVREAFPSIATGTSVTDGTLKRNQELEIVSHMDEGGVLFGDGIEADHLGFRWGMSARIRRAETVLRLVA